MRLEAVSALKEEDGGLDVAMDADYLGVGVAGAEVAQQQAMVMASKRPAPLDLSFVQDSEEAQKPGLSGEAEDADQPGRRKPGKRPRADWSTYRNEHGYFVCPFSPGRTFHNTSNLSKHCDKKHNGFRPPPRKRMEGKRRGRKARSRSPGRTQDGKGGARAASPGGEKSGHSDEVAPRGRGSPGMDLGAMPHPDQVNALVNARRASSMRKAGSAVGSIMFTSAGTEDWMRDMGDLDDLDDYVREVQEVLDSPSRRPEPSPAPSPSQMEPLPLQPLGRSWRSSRGSQSGLSGTSGEFNLGMDLEERIDSNADSNRFSLRGKKDSSQMRSGFSDFFGSLRNSFRFMDTD